MGSPFRELETKERTGDDTRKNDETRHKTK